MIFFFYVPNNKDDEDDTIPTGGADKHVTFSKENGEEFVGRKALLAKVNEIMKNVSSVNVGKNLISVVGKSGSGKTAFMVFPLFLSFFLFLLNL